MWIAPKVLIREDVRTFAHGILAPLNNSNDLLLFQKALYFPDIAGTALEPKAKTHTTTLGAGKVSVLSVMSTKISEVGNIPFHSLASFFLLTRLLNQMQAQSFVTPTLDKYQFDERFKYIQASQPTLEKFINVTKIKVKLNP